MIPTLRLPVALTAAALLLGPGLPLRAADEATPSATPTPVTAVATPAPTPDPEAEARVKIAGSLLDTMHMQATVEAANKRAFPMDQIADRMEKQPNATPEALAEVKKLREELHTLVAQGLGWEVIKPELAQAYADDFTLAELKEIDAFYHTPVGQKFVEKQPALNERLGKIIQQRSMTLVPTVRQKIQAVAVKLRPTPPPAPSPAGAAAGAPPVGMPRALPPISPVATSPVPAPTAAASATPTPPPAVVPKSITPVMPVTPSPM